jgi:hypothetical protein
MKKVLIIAPKHMGYIEKMVHELNKYNNIDVTDIHIPKYKYPKLSSKIKNFFLKNELKFEHSEKYINNIISDQTFDIILVIRPDLLSIKTLEELKSRTKYFKTYFFDGVNRFKRKLQRAPLFDEIFSFEPEDCKEFGFQFITNFIYEEKPEQSIFEPIKYSVFTISSYNKKRFETLLKVAELLKEQNQAHKIIVMNNKIESHNLIEIIKEPITLDETKLLLKQSNCMLDIAPIQKHKGLTFRVFEAMGLHKKIITNNPDIANYDFYNPQNILIINENNIDIPNSFLSSEYQPVPDEIYQKYTIQTWVKTMFKEVL